MNICNLTDEQFIIIENLAGLQYTPCEIAVYFGIDEDIIIREVESAGSEINRHYQTGILKSTADIEISLLNSAKSGNATSIQIMNKLLEHKRLIKIQHKILYGC